MKTNPLTTVEINLNALQHNLNVVKRLAPNSKVLAMVKANAYGHGLVPVAKALKKADGFGVARLIEAEELREAGVTQPIVLMPGIISEGELQKAAELSCDLVVHTSWQVDVIQKAQLKKPIRVWLKINSGMNRLGFLPDKVEAAYKTLMASNNVEKPIVLMTHFSDADDTGNPETLKQWQTFQTITQSCEGLVSAANSGAIVAFPETHADWVRPGIMLYGVSPLKDLTGDQHQLKPVMTLKSQIIAKHQLKKGDAVGYGSAWTCPCDMPIGIVGIGYGDGYPRYVKSGSPVLINGVECKLVGRVSMDMMAVDLRAAPDAEIGDEVTLWGEGLPTEKVAESAESIAYELLCHISPRPIQINYI